MIDKTDPFHDHDVRERIDFVGPSETSEQTVEFIAHQSIPLETENNGFG
jgi:hypothetical protein